MASESAVERAREAALAEQAERIAALGPAWRPGVDELREVVEGVLAADAAERARAQRDGIAAARERGVRLGRPRKERPEGYDRIASAVRAGALTRTAAARLLGISCETLRKWMKADGRPASGGAEGPR